MDTRKYDDSQSEEDDVSDLIFPAILTAMESMKDATAEKIYKRMQTHTDITCTKAQVDRALENALKYGVFEVRNKRYRLKEDEPDRSVRYERQSSTIKRPRLKEPVFTAARRRRSEQEGCPTCGKQKRGRGKCRSTKRTGCGRTRRPRREETDPDIYIDECCVRSRSPIFRRNYIPKRSMTCYGTRRKGYSALKGMKKPISLSCDLGYEASGPKRSRSKSLSSTMSETTDVSDGSRTPGRDEQRSKYYKRKGSGMEDVPMPGSSKEDTKAGSDASARKENSEESIMDENSDIVESSGNEEEQESRENSQEVEAGKTSRNTPDGISSNGMDIEGGDSEIHKPPEAPKELVKETEKKEGGGDSRSSVKIMEPDPLKIKEKNDSYYS